MKLAQQSNCIMRTLILLFSSTKERISILIIHGIHLNRMHKMKTRSMTNDNPNPREEPQNTNMGVTANDTQGSDVSNQSNQSLPPTVKSDYSDNEVNSVHSKDSFMSVASFYECNYCDCHNFGREGYPCCRCGDDSGSYFVGKKLDDNEMDWKVELMREQDEEGDVNSDDSVDEVKSVDSKDRDITFTSTHQCKYCDGHPFGHLGEPCPICHIGSHLS